VRRIIANGGGPSACDYDRRSALHLACCEGHVEMVRYLLDAGADVEAKDRFGGSPLDDAVRHGRTEIQALLRAHGARLRGDGYAIKICEAAAKGDLDTLAVLVENGVDTAVGDYDGRTALHLAASEGQVSVLHYLLEQDPPLDVNCVDRAGGTPLEDAVRHGHGVASMMLEDAGGVRKQQRRMRDMAARYRQLNAPDRLDMIWMRRWAKQTEMRIRNERQARVAELVAETTETRAVEGIRGKTIPALLAVLSGLSERVNAIVSGVDAAASPIVRALQPRGTFLQDGNFANRWGHRYSNASAVATVGETAEFLRMRRSAGNTPEYGIASPPPLTLNGFGVNGNGVDGHINHGYNGSHQIMNGRNSNIFSVQGGGGNELRAWAERPGQMYGGGGGGAPGVPVSSLILTPRSASNSTATTQETTFVTPFGEGMGFFTGMPEEASPPMTPAELSAELSSRIQALLDAVGTVRETLGVTLPSVRLVRFASKTYRAELVTFRRELRRARDTLRFLRRVLKAAAPLLRAANPRPPGLASIAPVKDLNQRGKA
jgi:DNA-binding transcriptional ArsR family regulator